MPKRILVVEDEPDIHTLIRMILAMADYEPIGVETLAAARAALGHGSPPDLALVDLLLPDGSGLDFCRELRAQHPSVPVVVLTAAVTADVRASALAMGCVHFLPKPFDPDTLHAVVALVLGDAPDRRRLGREGDARRLTAPRRAS